MKNKSTRTDKLIGSTISLSTVTIYATGVNLAKANLHYHNPIFISTVIITFISPYLLNYTTDYLLKKYSINKKLKKGDNYDNSNNRSNRSR